MYILICRKSRDSTYPAKSTNFWSQTKICVNITCLGLRVSDRYPPRCATVYQDPHPHLQCAGKRLILLTYYQLMTFPAILAAPLASVSPRTRTVSLKNPSAMPSAPQVHLLPSPTLSVLTRTESHRSCPLRESVAASDSYPVHFPTLAAFVGATCI